MNEGEKGAFPRTRWSVVLDAQGNDPAALADLCRIYWYPLYCYARRLRPSPEDAQDLIQAFFERLLSNDGLAEVRKERGKLRSYLLRSLHNFATELWRKAQTQKRGGGVALIELDALEAEQRYALEPKEASSPDLEFDRTWAREVLSLSLERLRTLYERTGKENLIEALAGHVMAGGDKRPYAEIGQELGMSESTVRYTAFKMRSRYRELLKEVILDTVGSEEEASEELAHLRTLFSN